MLRTVPTVELVSAGANYWFTLQMVIPDHQEKVILGKDKISASKLAHL